MSAWTDEDLARIGDAEEVELAIGGRSPVTIWIVRHGDEIYVRSVNGRGAAWFRSATEHGEGRLRARGVDADVALVESDEDVDAAYREKYGNRYPTIVPSIVAPGASATTLKLVPR